MADNKQNTGKPDRDRINLYEAYEVQYWTNKFGVSEAELKRAVKAVGDHAIEVEKYLKKKK
jgi:Protein of unknown function (DUF3606)